MPKARFSVTITEEVVYYPLASTDFDYIVGESRYADWSVSAAQTSVVALTDVDTDCNKTVSHIYVMTST